MIVMLHMPAYVDMRGVFCVRSINVWPAGVEIILVVLHSCIFVCYCHHVFCQAHNFLL
mgnify:CR=1 FL=1